MKKGVLVILLFLLLTNVSAIKIIPGVITGEAVTGKTTSHQTNISVRIIAYPPNITLYYPQNKTYIHNSSIPINFSCPAALAIWYNLDGSENSTLTPGTAFSMAEGTHTLNIYANNSDSVVSNLSIDFYINTSLLAIAYEEYKGAYKGNSAYFEEYAYEDLQNLSNTVLENTNYGKIKFNQHINVTEDSNFSDRIVDLDSGSDISFNRIEINSASLPNFNKPATLWLYGLAYSNPKVLKDGANCTACKIESYSGGILKFNVTVFSVYSAAETSSTTSAETPSPGEGGGGGLPTNRTSIEIEYPFPQEGIYIKRGAITLTIRQGDMKIENIEIDNKGSKKIIVRVYALNITEYLQINKAEFEMPVNSLENISIEFLIPESLLPDIYIGKLVIEAGNQTREIPISINVISRNPELEITTKIPERFLKIKPGKELEGTITINNFEDKEGTATLEYGVLDEYNTRIINYTEVIEIENLMELIREIKLPSNLKPGRYLFYAKVTFKEKTYSSSSWFYTSQKSLLPYTIAISMVIGAVILYFLFRKKKKKEDNKKDKKETKENNKKGEAKKEVSEKKYVMKNGYLEIKAK